MLGGMSGGERGSSSIPRAKPGSGQLAADYAGGGNLSTPLLFAMEPAVYDFANNEHGTRAQP